jgi:GSH-dependent disulfide-bond oxidoreductase
MAEMRPIELYYWPTPNGWKITIMLEELGAPYEVKYVNIGKGDQFAPDFLAIAPNNRMPAIVDPDGPGGKPISVFESAAILMYLGRKFGRFYPVEDERRRVEVEEWLAWQVANVGPVFGHNNHFRNYAPEKAPYAIRRFENEAHRLYRVLDTRLAGRDFVAGDYSIADMALIGWVKGHERQGIDIGEFSNVKRWIETLLARPAVERALKVGADRRIDVATDKEAQKVLFNQR